MDFRRVVRISPVLALIVGASGCASGSGRVALTSEARTTLHSVSVKRDITKPTEMFYRGSTEALLVGALGAAGTAAAPATSKGPAAELVATMDRTDIDVGRIVVEQFEAQLTASRLFASVLPQETSASQEAEAQFGLRIVRFGFGQRLGTPWRLKPVLAVQGTLVRPDGAVLWRDMAIVDNLHSETPASPHKEYIEQPELIRQAFTVAARIVARELVSHLSQER